MNIVKKEWVYNKMPEKYAQLTLIELKEYEFNGRIDFTSGPCFNYEWLKHIVYDDFDNATKVVIDGEVFPLFTVSTNPVAVERIRLSKNYGLQDFFNEHKNANCIVFYLTANASIFHDAYTIRVYIDEEGYKSKEEGVYLANIEIL